MHSSGGEVGIGEHDAKVRCNTDGHGGAVEHDTMVGCNADAGGCRLAGAGASKFGSETCKWADVEDSGNEGNCSAGGDSSRATRRASSAMAAQWLIDDIRSAFDRLPDEGRRTMKGNAWAEAELTPLVGKRKLSGKVRGCFLRWQGRLERMQQCTENPGRVGWSGCGMLERRRQV